MLCCAVLCCVVSPAVFEPCTGARAGGLGSRDTFAARKARHEATKVDLALVVTRSSHGRV